MDMTKLKQVFRNVAFLLAATMAFTACGGGSDDPAVFNYAMFDFQRLVAAPIVILCGIIIEMVAIMKVFKGNKQGRE